MIRSNAMTRSNALLLAAWLLGAAAATAQTAPPVQTAPVAPPPGVPSAPAPSAPAPSAPAPTPSAPAPVGPPAAGQPPRQTLVERPGDPSDVDEVTLAGKPAVVVSGQSTWDKAVENLKASFGRLDAEMKRAGLAPLGRPIAVFTRTDDDGFRYDAMVPIAAAPEPAPSLSEGVRLGTTPAGKALRFVHKGAYDDIDQTYETITAYLDAKGVVVQDAFVEEYAADLKDGSDTGLEVNIFAMPK